MARIWCRPRWWISGGALMLLPVRMIWSQCPDGTRPPCVSRNAVRPKPALRVVPFEHTAPDSSDAYLAASLTEGIVRLVRDERTLRLADGSSVADYLVTGSVVRTGSALSVAVRVLRLPQGRVIQSSRVGIPFRDAASAPDSVLAVSMRAMGLSPPRRRPTRRGSAEVYDLYSRGVYQMNRRSEPAMGRAVSLFQQAIAHDSSSALGWAGLARSLERAYMWRFAIPGISTDSLRTLQHVAVDRAIELEPDNAEVWLMRGRILANLDPTSRAAALTAFRRSVALDPSNGEAWRTLGLTLMEAFDSLAARSAFERSVEATPANGENVAWLGWYHHMLRDFPRATRWADSAIALDLTHTLPRGVAGGSALALGRLDDAEVHFEAFKQLSSGQLIEGHVGLARVAARRGDFRRARELLAEGAARTDSAQPFVHNPYQLAEGYLAVGDTAEALAWLERFPRRNLHFQMHLRHEPGLDGLRSHPRFQAILIRP